MGKGEVNKST
jgi:hypothetical protein